MRIGLASTDQLYFASGLLDCPGAMFTASHNPAAYNGIKLCRAGAKPVGKDTGLTSDQRRRHRRRARLRRASRAALTDRDVLADYGEFLRSLVDLTGAAPAAGRRRRRQRDGRPHRTGGARRDRRRSRCCRCTSNSTAPSPTTRPTRWTRRTWSTCRSTCVDTGADIGLAFDGDADRCFVVDERGHPVSPSAVTALVAARELSREIGATVIHNLITSRAVPELVAERGGTPVRSRVGHSYIKALMADTGAIFGGEHSAHYYFRDFWGADSGMLAALHVLAALGEQRRPLSELMADYQRYEASGEINFTVADAQACVEAVLKSFGDRIHSIDHLDGVTVDLGDGSWFNLRTSNTEPLLRLNVEGRTTEDVDAVVEQVAAEIAARSTETVARERHPGTSISTTPTACSPPTGTGLLRAASMAGAQVRAAAAAARRRRTGSGCAPTTGRAR